MEHKRFSERNYRKDHENFGEVKKTTFAKGKILEFGVKSWDPITLDDTVKVEIGGGVFNKVPIFYHCKKDFYVKDCAELEANKTLKRGAHAFEGEMEVKVMLQENSPVAVIGHADSIPRRCLDIIKLVAHGYASASAFGPQVDSDERYVYHFRCSDQTVFCDLQLTSAAGVDAVNCKAPDGQNLNCTRKAKHICGQREIKFGTVVYHMGDWLIHLGPLLFIFMVYAVGLPGPYTGQVWMCAAPYSKDLEERTIAKGLEKEKVLPDRIWQPIPPEEFYPDFVIQTKFTSILRDRFQGYKWPQPRWIYTEWFAQEWKL